MLHDPMSVRIAKWPPIFGRCDDLVTAGVLALLTLSREEDVVVINLLAQRSYFRVVVPLLHKDDARLGSCMRLESVCGGRVL